MFRDLAPFAGTVFAVGALVAGAGDDDGVVLCPFRRCTGGYCPGCGATRAANRLARGDIHGSWSHHPWVALALVQFVVLVAAGVGTTGAARRRRLRRLTLPLVIANTALLIGIWIIRLSTDTIPTGWL